MALSLEKPLLIAAIGSDVALNRDLTALRAVRAQTGMQFIHIPDATFAKLKSQLYQQRASGHRYNLHMAVHSGEQGIELGGVIVDAVALSEILEGVQVLMIAGCESAEVADLLGVVPFVVSFTEQVSHEAASELCKNFWMEIGQGGTPERALREALRLSPPNVSEFVTRHRWRKTKD